MGNWYGYILHWSHVLTAFFGRRNLLIFGFALEAALAAWIVLSVKKRDH